MTDSLSGRINTYVN